MLVAVDGYHPGDIRECDGEEAGRLINAGHATPVKQRRRIAVSPDVETAVLD